MGFMTCVISIFATPLPTKSNVPTGGVHNPIHRLITITIPKCTGCMPMLVTIGRKMGVKINTAGVMSIKVPTSSKIKFIISKMTIGLLKFPSRFSEISSGTLLKANSHDRAIEVHIKNMTMAVVFALESMISGNFLKLI